MGLRNPAVVRLDTEATLSERLRLAFFSCRGDDKPAALLHLLREVVPPEAQAVVFCSTRHHVELLAGPQAPRLRASPPCAPQMPPPAPGPSTGPAPPLNAYSTDQDQLAAVARSCARLACCR